MNSATKVGAVAVNPLAAAQAIGVSSAFGPGGAHPQWQYGNDDFFNTASPEDIATKLGQEGFRPGYDSNAKGSYERTYNSILDKISSNPDLLVKRYSTGKAGQFDQTPQDQLNYQAYQTFKSILGRDPSGAEFASILPSFQGPNGAIGGRAAIAQLQQQYKLNPSIDPNSPQNKSTPQDFTKQISDTFQSTVGRAPTANEISHFQDAFSKGSLDAYGLEGVIKQSPEYTNAQDQKFRSGLNQELTNYDTYAFQRMGAPQLFSQYAQNGMPAGTSPSLDYAMTDLMGRMAQNRSNYLAQLSAQQYGGNKDLANQNYQDTTNQLLNNWSSNLNRSQGMNDFLTQRGYGGLDYTQQRNDYLNYIGTMRPGGNSPLRNALGGATSGAMIGGSIGGPFGAGLGAVAGGAFGYLS